MRLVCRCCGRDDRGEAPCSRLLRAIRRDLPRDRLPEDAAHLAGVQPLLERGLDGRGVSLGGSDVQHEIIRFPVPLAQHVQAAEVEALPVTARDDDHVLGLLIAVFEVEVLDVAAAGAEIDVAVPGIGGGLLEPGEQERPEAVSGVRVIDGDAFERGAAIAVGVAERHSRERAVDGQRDRQPGVGSEVGEQGVIDEDPRAACFPVRVSGGPACPSVSQSAGLIG